MTLEIPEVVINRLPVYARALASLADSGEEVVSSHTLGEHLGVTPAQIRKDLSYFGRFGKQGRGYNVRGLLTTLREILGLDQQWRVCVVGIGRLGEAIVEYGGFRPHGFNVISAFDADPEVIGRTIGQVTIQHADRIEETLRAHPVDIGVVAVPAAAAQSIIDRLVRAGIRAILNYAPAMATVPAGVTIRQIDPVLAMQGMTYFLKRGNEA